MCTEATTISKTGGGRRGSAGPIRFDIWGCRGSKSYIPARSRIGNHTSCYSLQAGSDLYVFDAGLGLASLSYEIHRQDRFAGVKRVNLLITHAHLDHWEGLKDADWFWQRENGLEIRIFGLDEAINAIQRGYEHPSFVSLDLLARGTISHLEFRSFSFGDVFEVGDWKVENVPLNHYSGTPEDKSVLQTSGYRLSLPNGPVVCYISDHEPTEETLPAEKQLTRGGDLVVYDAHFPDIKDQRYGHGSQEHAANMARQSKKLLVIAGHHGPMFSDVDIDKTYRRHSVNLPNFYIAVEGESYVWDEDEKKFVFEGTRTRHPDMTAETGHKPR